MSEFKSSNTAGLQDVEAQLAAFGHAEGRFPEQWTDFFKFIEQLEKKGSVAAAGTACKRVLSALVWTADAIQGKSTLHDYAYADVTMFIRNWGQFAPEVVSERGSLKVKAEGIALSMVQSRDKMKCLRCNHLNHLDSMCYSKGKGKDFRSTAKARQPDRDEDRRGFGRSNSRDRRDRPRYDRK